MVSKYSVPCTLYELLFFFKSLLQQFRAQCTSRSSMFLLCKCYLNCRLQVTRLRSSCWQSPPPPPPCQWPTKPRPEFSQKKGQQEAASGKTNHADTCCHHQYRAEGWETLGQKVSNTNKEKSWHQWANKPKCRNVSLPYCIWTVMDAMSMGKHMQKTIHQHRHCVKRTSKSTNDYFHVCLHPAHGHIDVFLQPARKTTFHFSNFLYVVVFLGPKRFAIHWRNARP